MRSEGTVAWCSSPIRQEGGSLPRGADAGRNLLLAASRCDGRQGQRSDWEPARPRGRGHGSPSPSLAHSCHVYTMSEAQLGIRCEETEGILPQRSLLLHKS